MEIQFILNQKQVTAEAGADTILLDVLRGLGCKSVKCGCETTNCGLCTVWIDEKPVLSCAVLAARIDGKRVTTLEGLQEEATEFAMYMGREGADQCGFCNPGFVMNVLAMARELEAPTEEEIKEYLAGNLCRCTGYVGHMRAIRDYLQAKGKAVQE